MREAKLPIPAKLLTNDFPKAAWLEGDRWAVVVSDRGVGGKASGWWLNASNGNSDLIAEFKSSPISRIVGSGDGGFVALVVTHHKYSMEDALIAFDQSGKVRWQIKEDYDDEKALFSPEDLTLTESRHIAVLDNIRKAIQFFDLDGKFLMTRDLEKSWGREPNYPSEITTDKNDGILVKDFDGNPPVVRMDKAGKVAGQFVPQHPNGRVVDAVQGLKVTRAGNVWACDGECFVRLRDDGVSDLVLGGAPTEESLGKIAGLTIDQGGRLHAVDERTGAVHVFDKNGNRLRLLKPEVTDFKGKLSLAQVAVSSDGGVYINDKLSSRSFVHFAPGGGRLGVKRFGLDDVTQELYSIANRKEMIMIGYHDVFIVDEEGNPARTIQRRSDRNWLANPDRASVGADGSFAILTRDRGYWRKTPWDVNLYSATGDPLRTVTLPAACMDSCFAYSGKYLATRTKSEICVFGATGEPVGKFSPAWDDFKSERCECFATFEGRELWFVSVDTKSVCRFELP